MPNDFALTPNNLVLITSGFDPVLRWDGFSSQTEPAGVLPPASALTLAGSGTGNIVGTYWAYSRFVDQYGNFSNFSPISAEFDAAGTSGAVTQTSADTPVIVTTSAAHGLVTGNIVKLSGLGTATDLNANWVVTVLSTTTFSLDGSSGLLADTGGGTWQAGVGTITYTGVPVPVESKVRRRQILRNSDGQANVFYVDVDTTNLASTTLTSTRVDSDLTAQQFQSFNDASGRNVANVFTPPPNWKEHLVFHQDRMLYMGESDYAEGNVSVAFGSTTVTGIATEWGIALQGRLLYVDGSTQTYTIQSVDVTNQTLTLSTAYLDATSTYGFYAIRPEPGQRRLIYWSEAGLPEAVPAFNAVSLQSDNDDITGGVVFRSFVYVLERRHLYKMSWSTGPDDDGGIFLAAERGCVSPRCAIVVNDKCYMLDEQGIHAFGGSQEDEAISSPIQGLFRQESTSRYTINWSAQRFFHAVLSPAQEVIRWFVSLSGDYLPRHAICYAYRLQRWWVEEYAVPVGASCVGRSGASANTWRSRQEQVYLGSRARQVLAIDRQRLDGADPTSTNRGQVTSAGLLTLTDTAANFVVAAGVPVSIVSGRGAGQTRNVVSATATTLTLDRPWAVMPAALDVYQIGGVKWLFRTGLFTHAQSEPNAVRSVDVMFVPTIAPASMTIRRYIDFSTTADEMGFTMASEQGQGVGLEDGSGDIICDLTKPDGFVAQRLDGRSENRADGQRFVQFEFTGYTGDTPITLLAIGLDGTVQH